MFYWLRLKRELIFCSPIGRWANLLRLFATPFIGQTTVITEQKLKNELLADQYLQGSEHAGANGSSAQLRLPQCGLQSPQHPQLQQQPFGNHDGHLQGHHANSSPRLIPPLHDKFAHLLADTMFCCGRRKVCRINTSYIEAAIELAYQSCRYHI